LQPITSSETSLPVLHHFTFSLFKSATKSAICVAYVYVLLKTIVVLSYDKDMITNLL